MVEEKLCVVRDDGQNKSEEQKIKKYIETKEA